MRALSDTQLLDLWEAGLRRHPLDRALLALGAAIPETPHHHLAGWALGRRNRALAELRQRCFGTDLTGWVACPRCSEKLEFTFDTRAIAATEPDPGSGSREEVIVFEQHRFRLPTSRDLALAGSETDPRRGAVRILESCRLGPAAGVSTAAVESGSRDWSEEELEQIGERMAAADPMAETRLSLHCPACGNDWDETLDLVSFLWSEIDARARRLLHEIHMLASAYGWTEAQILSLGEDRRARYVEMVQS